jgi:PAS domain S-box-containing protein
MKNLTMILLFISLSSFGTGEQKEESISLVSENEIICTTSLPVAANQSLSEQISVFFSSVLDTQWWPARWHCGIWSPFHGWLYILSDAIIALSYFLIPLILLYFLYKRKQQSSFQLVVLLFIFFILACGLTHSMDAAMFWWPAYRVSALIKVVTASLSVGTVFALVKIAPQLMQLKGPGALEQIVNERTEELRKSTLLNVAYQKALDESSIVAFTDQRGKIKHVNENFCKISKYSKAELIGQDHRIINSAYHSKEFIRDLWVTIANGKIWKGELKNKAKDGTIYWVDTTIVPFLNEEGKPYQYVAIRADITERKKLEEQQSLLASIVNFSDDAILSRSLGGIITTWNRGAERIFGYTSDEILGAHVSILIPPHLLHEESEIVGKISRGEVLDRYETLRVRKDGKVINVSLTISPVKDSRGIIIGASKISRDITQQKIAEENLQKSLKETSDYKYALDESSIVAITDQKGIIQHANDNFCKISKYNREELIGQDHRIINSGYHSKEFIRSLWVNIAKGKIWKGELKNKAKDGTIYWVDTTIVPFLNEQGKPYQYVAIRSDITDRKIIEEKIYKLNTELDLKALGQTDELLQSKDLLSQTLQRVSFLASIADNIQDPVITSDNNFVITRWNKASETLLEWKSEEAIGKSTEILGIVYSGQTRDQVLSSFMEKGFWQGELIYHTKSGRPVNVMITASKLNNAEDGTVGNLILVRNITERIQAEKQLKEFEYFFNNSNDLSCIANTEGYFEIVNPSFNKILGYSRNELATKPFLDFVHPDDIEKTLEVYGSLKSGATLINFINRYRKADGSYVLLDWNATPNPVTGKLYCIARDITERKKAEDALNKLNEELEQRVIERTEEVIKNEKRFRALIENSTDGLTVINADGIVVEISPSGRKILGYDEGEIIGKNRPDLIHPEDRDKVMNAFKEIIVDPKNIKLLQYRHKMPDGSDKWLECAFHNLLNEPNIKAIVLNYRDITDRKTIEENLEKSEMRFRLLIENSSDGIDLSDEFSNSIYRSPGAIKITGNLQKENQMGLTHPDDVETIKNLQEEFIKKPQIPIAFQARFRHALGHYIWVEGTVTNLLHVEGVNGFVTNFRDITQRKELEVLLHKANTLARIGGWEVDLVKGTVFWSDITREIHETAQDYMPDMENGINFYKGPGRVLITQKVKEAIEFGTPWDVELQIITAKNNERWIRSIGEPEFADGKCLRLYGSFQDITERSKAEIERERLNERFQLARQSAQLGQWDWDVKNNKLIWDEVMYRLYNLTENEFPTVYDGWASRIHAEDRQRVDNDIQLALAGKKDYNPEFRIVWTDSSIHYINASGIIERDYDGNAVRMTGFNWDVTERKNAEEKLIESEKIYRSIYENTGEAILFTIPNGTIISANAVACQIFDRTEEEICSVGLGGLVNTPDPVVSVGLEERKKTGLLKAEWTFIKPDGTKFPGEVTSTVFKNSEGEERTITIIRDITERKKSEEKLSRERTLLRTLIDNLPDYIYIKDTQSRHLINNKANVALFGVATEEETIGKSIADFFGTETGSSYMEDDQLVLQSGKAILNKEETIISPTGETKYMLTTKVPLTDQANVIIGLVGISRDITWQKKIELDLREKTYFLEMAHEELEQKVVDRTAQLAAANKELEAFSYSVSHDLRAPLRAINGYAKMLEEDYLSILDDNGKRLLGIVQHKANEMGILIDELLSLSRLGRKELHKSSVDMGALAKSIIKEMPTSNAKIVIGTLLKAEADVGLIRQVLVNLISNAVKYSSKLERPAIEIGSFSEASGTVYYVKDNGAGFDMAYGSKLFGVFQRLHSQEEFEGTGVGLAIVKLIIEKHNGRVWAEGEPEKGATFFFSLPTSNKVP